MDTGSILAQYQLYGNRLYGYRLYGLLAHGYRLRDTGSGLGETTLPVLLYGVYAPIRQFPPYVNFPPMSRK